MSRVSQIVMGRRGPHSSSDSTCTFGVVFGAEVVEIDRKFVTVWIEYDDATDEASDGRANVYVLQASESTEITAANRDKCCLAFGNIDKDLVQSLVSALHLLIKNKLSYEVYVAITELLSDKTRDEWHPLPERTDDD